MKSRSATAFLLIAAMVAVAAGGSALVRLAALAIPNAGGTGAHSAYLAVIRDAPIPVVQEATGWGVLLAVWALFGALAYLGFRLSKTGASAGVIVFAFVAVATVLTFFPITQSIDIYYYAAYGRLYGLHGINPYDLPAALHLGDAVLDDNLKPLSNPPFADSYGPGFTLFAGLVARMLGGASLWWQLWVWRFAAFAAACAVIGALLRLSRGVEGALRAVRVARFAFNPLVLYEAAVGGHNDWLMVAPAVWSFALVEEMPLIAGLLIGTAIAVKYMAAIVLPFLALSAWRKSRAAGLLLVVLAGLVPLLCARPFALGQSAAHTLATVGSQLSMSLNWILTLPFFLSGTAGDQVLSGLAPLPLLGVLTWPRIIQLAVVAALFAGVAISVAQYARRPDRGLMHRSVTALLWALPAMHPWYLTWLSPALAQSGPWGEYAAWYLSLGLLVYAHEGLALTPWREAIFACIVVATLIVPVAIARRSNDRWLSPTSRRRNADSKE